MSTVVIINKKTSQFQIRIQSPGWVIVSELTPPAIRAPSPAPPMTQMREVMMYRAAPIMARKKSCTEEGSRRWRTKLPGTLMCRCALVCVQITHTPDPVDHLDLLVQLHHEDDKEDDGEDHLADGNSRVASIQRRSIADEDDETEYLGEIWRGYEENEIKTECLISQESPRIYQWTNGCCLNSAPLLEFAGYFGSHYLNSSSLPTTGPALASRCNRW